MIQKNTFLRYALIFFIFLPTILFFPTNSYASIEFHENFDNTDPNGTPLGWIEEVNPNAWNVINGSYVSELNVPNSEALTYFNTPSDFIIDSVETDVTGISGPDRFLIFRYDSKVTNGVRGYTLKWFEKPFPYLLEMWGIPANNCTKYNESNLPEIGWQAAWSPGARDG